jgi:hypothetical protein
LPGGSVPECTRTELDFDVLLTGDGVPILRDARAGLRELVASFPT